MARKMDEIVRLPRKYALFQAKLRYAGMLLLIDVVDVGKKECCVLFPARPDFPLPIFPYLASPL